VGDVIPLDLCIDKFRIPHYCDIISLTNAHNELWDYDKVAIVGGPSGGKTYLANLISRREDERAAPRAVWCSDVMFDVPWEAQPLVLTARMETTPQWIAEGTAVLRAVRHGLLKPDVLVLRDAPVQPLSIVQQRLWQFCRRWWADILYEQPKLRVAHVVTRKPEAPGVLI
jgi:hypothetical protein